MTRTFEEAAGAELDALYQGALFLAGGKANSAERLLVEAVSLAFRERVDDTDPRAVQRLLEARLVRSFLRNVESERHQLSERTAPRMMPDANTLESLGSGELFSAAAAVPAWPRAALWLVLLRRWSYGDAASAMGVDERSMEDLLSYRDVLLTEMLSSSRGGPMRLGIM